MLAQHCAALTLGQATPDAELDAVVQSVGTALQNHWAVAADNCGFALCGAANEQLIRVNIATLSARNPLLAIAEALYTELIACRSSSAVRSGIVAVIVASSCLRISLFRNSFN